MYPPGPDEIHLWFTSLIPMTAAPRWREQMSLLLTTDEQCKAAKAINQKLRDRALASRSSLRRILGMTLDQAPGSVEIEVTGNGRPFIPGMPIDFSVAHSGDLMVVATTGQGPIGVDLEMVTEFEGMREIAAERFIAQDAAAVAEATEDELTQRFHRAWVRHEAVLKAIGTGLMGDERDAGMFIADFHGPGGTLGSVARETSPNLIRLGVIAPA